MHSCPRTASVRAATSACFATISSRSYNEIIGKYHEYLYHKKIRWLQTFPILDKSPTSIVYEVFKKMKRFEKSMHNTIYEEGDKP